MISNKDLKKGWADLIKEKITDGDHHLVITFKYDGLTEPETRRSLNYFLYLLNRRFFGQNFKKNDIHIKGFVFMELQGRGTPHYHILLVDDAAFHVEGKKSLRTHVYESISKVRKIQRRTGETKYQIIKPEGTELSPVYSDRIVDYVMKSMSGGDDSFIGILDKDGVVGCNAIICNGL